MSHVTIKIPSTLTLQTALRLSLQLARIEGAASITAEFGGEGSVEPFAMLLISSELQRAAARNHVESFTCKNHERMTYAASMGFFGAFGYQDAPRRPGNKNGSSRHLPVNILNCEKLRDEAFSEGTEVGNIVESKAKQLAAMLCGADSGDLYDALSYSIREIIRNSVEHSESKQIGICAEKGVRDNFKCAGKGARFIL